MRYVNDHHFPSQLFHWFKHCRGEPKIDVSFALDSNGILNVTAKDQKTGAEEKIQIERKGQSTDDEIAEMAKSAEAYRQEEEEDDAKIDVSWSAKLSFTKFVW